MDENMHRTAHRKIAAIVDSKIMPVNFASGLGMQRRPPLRRFFDGIGKWQFDRFGVPLNCQGTDENVAVPLFIDAIAAKRHGGKEIRLEKIGSLQMSIPLLNARVY